MNFHGSFIISNFRWVDSTKFLGAVLYSTILFRCQIDSVCKEKVRSIFAILNLKKGLPIKELIN